MNKFNKLDWIREQVQVYLDGCKKLDEDLVEKIGEQTIIELTDVVIGATVVAINTENLDQPNLFRVKASTKTVTLKVPRHESVAVIARHPDYSPVRYDIYTEQPFYGFRTHWHKFWPEWE